MVIVRQATLDDKPAIFEFLKQIHPTIWPYRVPERWEWEFENNPYAALGDLHVWIAVDEETGKIAGQNCALVEPMWMEGQLHMMSWGVDFHVLEEYRGMGLGKKLYGAMLDHASISLTLNQSQASRHVMLRLGMQPLPSIPIFTRIIRHETPSVLKTLSHRLARGSTRTEKLASRLLSIFQLHRMTAAALTLRETWRDRNLASRMDPRIELVSVQQFSADQAEAIWKHISPAYKGLMYRDANFLNWKYDLQPHMEYKKWVINRDGSPCGYLILRRSRPPERNVGLVADLFVHPDDQAAIQTALAFSCQYFRQQGVAIIEAAAGPTSYKTVLASLGFKPTRNMEPVILYDHPFPTDGWFFSRSDHDRDQYPLA